MKAQHCRIIYLDSVESNNMYLNTIVGVYINTINDLKAKAPISNNASSHLN